MLIFGKIAWGTVGNVVRSLPVELQPYKQLKFQWALLGVIALIFVGVFKVSKW